MHQNEGSMKNDREHPQMQSDHHECIDRVSGPHFFFHSLSSETLAEGHVFRFSKSTSHASFSGSACGTSRCTSRFGGSSPHVRTRRDCPGHMKGDIVTSCLILIPDCNQKNASDWFAPAAGWPLLQRSRPDWLAQSEEWSCTSEQHEWCHFDAKISSSLDPEMLKC